jgi:SAM-dependent methyltransferase
VSDAPPVESAVLWHDVECGGYGGDLPLWRELARRADGPVLELGAGTGRVALDLAEAGHRVTALDSDPVLLDELARRARKAGLHVASELADARRLSMIGPFALILAPMQFAQLMGGAAARAELLAEVASSLAPGGVFAAAVADLDEAVGVETAEPSPQVGDGQSWMCSSVPLHVRLKPGGVAVDWLRRLVSPTGEVTEDRHTEVFDYLTPAELEREAQREGLRAEDRRELAHADGYIGSTVVVCRRPSPGWWPR